MKIKQYHSSNGPTVNGVNLGLNQRDSVLLRRETNHEPIVQIFTLEDLDDEPAEERTYWCAICRSRLTYVKHTDTVWRCDSCMEYYDTKIQDIPIKDKSEDWKLHSHHDPYRPYDENDPNIVFVKGIDPDKYQQQQVEVIRSSPDQRIKHIRVRGNLAEALSQL